jgi:hypothetical protein
MDNAAGTLFGIYPVSYFHERELENSDVDYVAGMVAHLYPISDRERLAPQDKRPSCDALYNILQSYRESGGHQSNDSGQGLHTRKPHSPYQDNRQAHGDISYGLSPPIADRWVLRTVPYGAR